MLELKEYIKGKSIAFVGLAPNIISKGLGAEIDSFDVVIRTNLFPLPDEYRDDYGHTCQVISMLRSSQINPEVLLKNGIKWVIYYRPLSGRNISDKLEYYYMTVDRRNEIRRDIMQVLNGFNPGHGSSGTNIIGTVLKCSPRQIKMFGVTGYQDKNGKIIDHNKGVKHYIPYFRTNRSFISMERHPSHHFAVQNDWLRYLLKTSQIQMDEFSYEYFK